jgi:hypothetical protein
MREVRKPFIEPKTDGPNKCEVYLFYFRGYEENKELLDRLKLWGEGAGDNLFVGIWDEGDPELLALYRNFHLSDMPAVVMTGSESVAMIIDGREIKNSFTKIDNKKYFRNTALMMDFLYNLHSCYLQGDIMRAMQIAQKNDNLVDYRYYSRRLIEIFRSIAKEIHENDVDFGLTDGGIHFSKKRPAIEGNPTKDEE